MSDENNKSDDSISDYVSLLGELTGDTETEDVGIDQSEELDFIVQPSAKDVADQAYNNLTDDKDKEELPFDDPRPVIIESERQFCIMRDELVEKVEEIKQKEEGSVSGADIDTMLYLVDKKGGKTGKFTIFGGAESLIYNTAERNGWNKYETELVYEANRIAARQNNLHRHLLLDTVVIIPNSLEMVE